MGAVLDEIVVVEVASGMVGAITSMLLGDYGARVIKVERSGESRYAIEGRSSRVGPQPFRQLRLLRGRNRPEPRGLRSRRGDSSQCGGRPYPAPVLIRSAGRRIIWSEPGERMLLG